MKGLVYVPTGCQNGEECRVHIHMHGCGIGLEFWDTYYARNIGYNEIAEANNIIILYPQAKTADYNPRGCFDVFGML